ncbi:MAG: protein kinase domain-containing protein [Verrucomicrobiales bacterium]
MSMLNGPCPRCGKGESINKGLCPKCLLSDIFPELEASPSDQTQKTGLHLENYDLMEEIGRGGHGIVFRAQHRELGYSVAIKALAGGPFISSEGKARFDREAKAAAKLRHPNIVRVLEYGEKDGRPWLAMDFIEGEDLATRLRKNLPSIKQVAEWISKLACAVHHAHQAGIIHRDIKPANILLDRLEEPILSDFGVAGVLDGSDLTVTHQTIGSFHYMAPEQISTNARVGPQADVYALGAVMYHCLTGRPPLGGATIPDLIRGIGENEPISPSRLNASTPRDLETICLKCLSKDPLKRYNSAALLADDLQSFLRGQPVSARPITSLQRTLRWAQRRPKVAALVVVSLCSLLAGMGVALWQWNVAVELAASERKSRAAAEQATLTYQASLTKALFQEAGVEALSKRFPQALARIAWILRNDPNSKIAFEWANDLLQNFFATPLCPETEFESQITKAQFSPKDSHIFLLGDTGLLEIWNVERRPFKTYSTRFEQPIIEAAWMEDGKSLVAIDADGMLWLDLSQTNSSPARINSVSGVSTAASGRDHVALGRADGMVAVWNPRDSTLLYSTNIGAPIRLMNLSNRGNWLAIKDSEKTLKVIALNSGMEQQVQAKAPITAMAFSWNEKWFTFGCEDGSMQTLMLKNMEIIPVLKKHLGPVLSLQFDKTLNHVLSIGGDGLAKWTKIDDVGLLKAEYPVDSKYPSASISNDGYYVMTTVPSGHGRIFVAKPGKAVLDPLRQKSAIILTALSGHRRRALTVSQEKRFRVWDIPPATSYNPIITGIGHVANAKIASDTGPVVTLNAKGKLELWTMPHQHSLAEPIVGPSLLLEEGMEQFELSPAGEALIAWNKKKFVAWNIRGKAHHLFHGESVYPAQKVIINSTATHAAIASNKHIELWSMNEAKKLSELSLSESPSALAISSNGTRFVIGHENGLLRIYSVAEGKQIKELHFGSARISFVDYSRDGLYLALTSDGGLAQIFSAETLQPMSKPFPHYFKALWGKFRSRGDEFVTGGQDGAVRIWNWKEGTLMRLYGHGEASMRSMTRFLTHMDSGHQRILTFAEDRFVRMWDIESGLKFRPDIEHSIRQFGPSISPGGRWLLTASSQFKLELRDLNPPATVAPPWLPDFIEDLVGFSYADDGSYHWKPPLSVFEMLEKYPIHEVQNEPWIPLILR